MVGWDILDRGLVRDYDFIGHHPELGLHLLRRVIFPWRIRILRVVGIGLIFFFFAPDRPAECSDRLGRPPEGLCEGRTGMDGIEYRHTGKEYAGLYVCMADVIHVFGSTRGRNS
jgi:hypothetical protein